MTSLPLIMIVDDEAPNRLLLVKTLEHDYQVVCAESAEDCLSQLVDIKPDMFLLDVLMPEVDGFSLCSQLRSQHRFIHTPILFVSALTSLDTKLKCYESGGDDYTTKPIEIAEIRAKVKLKLDRHNQSITAIQDAMDMAMTAMTNGSEIGEINQFLERLQDSYDLKMLSDHALNSCTNFGVHAVIQLRTTTSLYSVSNSGNVNHLEEELINEAKYAKRIMTFGRRCLFNFKNCSLLIRNMPEDEDKAGRYRDHLASIMNGVESRIDSLHIELAYKEQKESHVVEALSETHKRLDGVLQKFKQQDSDTLDVIDSLMADMQMAFSYLDLDTDQEDYFTSLINRSMTRLTALSVAATELDREFYGINNNLRKVLNPDGLKEK